MYKNTNLVFDIYNKGLRENNENTTKSFSAASLT
jgi:hypothetical protein